MMKKFKLLWKNGFENRVDVEFSAPTDSHNMFGAGGIVSK
jgi:hypothetical protein